MADTAAADVARVAALLLAGACAVTACHSSVSASVPSYPASAPASPASPAGSASGNGATGAVSSSESLPAAPPVPGSVASTGNLSAVAVVSASDAWAVSGVDSGLPFGNVIVHWNGSRWRQVPDSLSETDALLSVAATSASDAWAVGGTVPGETGKGATHYTIILHWDGRAWTRLPRPLGGTLFSVAARSRGDAWAVGDSPLLASETGPPLIEHWDGKAWTVTPSPDVANAALDAVAAISPSDAWAVGTSGAGSFVSGVLIEHWDGKAWTRVRSPAVANGSLVAVAAVSASDVWAVGSTGGYVRDGSWIPYRGLVEHWNGRTWTVVPSPGLRGGSLAGVAAISPRDAWAVGSVTGGPDVVNGAIGWSADTSSKTLIEHWDGRTWRQVSSREPGQSSLSGVAAASASDAWAVGGLSIGGVDYGIIAHWDGKVWR